MADYTYDPTQGKIVPVSQARVVTYITTDSKGLPDANAPTGSPYNVSSTAGDELLKKQAAANAAATASTGTLTPAAIAALAIKAADAAVADAKAKSTAATKAAAKNVGTGPDAKADQAAAADATKTLKEVTAAAKDIRINFDPDVLAARENQAAAAGEVEATANSLKTALTNLETLTNSFNDGPSVEVTQALLNATAGLDTNVGLSVITATPASTLTPATVVQAPADVTGIKPVGTPPAYVYDSVSKTWVMPAKPTDGQNYVWDNNTGWTVSTLIPGSTGITTDTPTGPTLAINTFKNTLALFFGPNEISKPWVDVLYKSVSGFYKTGSTAEESFNMALQDVRNNPIMEPFTKRFKGIFALQDLKVTGVAVTVPTIAEYFASESKMGDVLRSSGLGDIANEDFLGDVLGKNVSVTEFSNRIVNIFDRIDSAPKEIKDTFSRYFPTVDRLSLAKALALGDKGAKALEKEIAGYEVLSAAEQQGIGANKVLGGVDVERAANYAAKGYGYQKALTDFGKVARIAPVEKKLAEISGVESLGQVGVENAVLGQNLTAQQQLEVLAELEGARYSGKSGTIGSKSFASQNRGMLY
jgi:hypothetical protein